MHASTRILLFMVAVVAIVGGWWVLVVNNPFPAAVVYASLWTAAVLLVTFLLIKVGFGYNRYSARRKQGGATQAASAESALAELKRLRDNGLISAEEYEAKRTQIIDRL